MRARQIFKALSTTVTNLSKTNSTLFVSTVKPISPLPTNIQKPINFFQQTGLHRNFSTQTPKQQSELIYWDWKEKNLQEELILQRAALKKLESDDTPPSKDLIQTIAKKKLLAEKIDQLKAEIYLECEYQANTIGCLAFYANVDHVGSFHWYDSDEVFSFRSRCGSLIIEAKANVSFKKYHQDLAHEDIDDDGHKKIVKLVNSYFVALEEMGILNKKSNAFRDSTKFEIGVKKATIQKTITTLSIVKSKIRHFEDLHISVTAEHADKATAQFKSR